jgi:SAM-dependent methyltransferase
MPFSIKAGKKIVRKHLLDTLPSTTRVLDVGAGEGTYHTLLGDYFPAFDAVEIHEPYIGEYKLKDKYREVFHASAVDFDGYDNYDLVIFGDVLEHISVADTQAILAKCKNVKEVLIAVPYESKQGAWHGVESERHIQEDLTPELFDSRYPGFRTIYTMKRRKNSSVNPKGELSYGYYLRASVV